MVVDGKAIAGDIYLDIKKQVDEMKTRPHLTVFTCAPNFETQKYLSLKKRKAEEIGIGVNVIELSEAVTTKEAVLSLRCASQHAGGLIVQLPFPEQVDIDELLEGVPVSKDVDVINYSGEESEILPPVVGAVAEIAKRYGVEWKDKQVVVVGSGRLVGKPAALWAAGQGAKVEVIDKDTKNSDDILRSADIIISGAGVSGLITADKIKEGVALFDAGTSEEGGMLKGDADPAVAAKCALFTPVPGGIGPITVAVLLRNLVTLS